jgi:hypothetical protein
MGSSLFQDPKNKSVCICENPWPLFFPDPPKTTMPGWLARLLFRTLTGATDFRSSVRSQFLKDQVPKINISKPSPLTWPKSQFDFVWKTLASRHR